MIDLRDRPTGTIEPTPMIDVRDRPTGTIEPTSMIDVRDRQAVSTVQQPCAWSAVILQVPTLQGM